MVRQIIYISGGARSGKSRLAQQMAEAMEGSHLFVATAQAYDAEMTDRIHRHQQDRDDRWETWEAPLDLAETLTRHGQPSSILLVDCITLWLTNHMLGGSDLDAERRRLCAAVADFSGRLILVSNEVGMGIVPDNALARQFRDEAGRTNQQLAALAHQAYFTVSGIPMRLR